MGSSYIWLVGHAEYQLHVYQYSRSISCLISGVNTAIFVIYILMLDFSLHVLTFNKHDCETTLYNKVLSRTPHTSPLLPLCVKGWGGGVIGFCFCFLVFLSGYLGFYYNMLPYGFLELTLILSTKNINEKQKKHKNSSMQK